MMSEDEVWALKLLGPFGRRAGLRVASAWAHPGILMLVARLSQKAAFRRKEKAAQLRRATGPTLQPTQGPAAAHPQCRVVLQAADCSAAPRRRAGTLRRRPRGMLWFHPRTTEDPSSRLTRIHSPVRLRGCPACIPRCSPVAAGRSRAGADSDRPRRLVACPVGSQRSHKLSAFPTMQ